MKGAAPHSVDNVTASEVMDAAEVERWFSALMHCGDASACQLLVAAAEKGNHPAEAYMGIVYFWGCKMLAKDTEKALLYTQRAIAWLKAEVSKGNKHAQFLLGDCYSDGRGVAKDETEAVRLCKMAADQGLAVAQYSLGTSLSFNTLIYIFFI